MKILLKIDFKLCKKFIKDENNFGEKLIRRKVNLLRGWFQSYDFLPNYVEPATLAKKDAQTSNKIALHIRLTDFAIIDSNPLNANYYKKAIELIPDSLKSHIIACYSDDIPKAKIILGGINNIYFPELKKELDPVELLGNLSSAEFLNCSRSSLCWWASLSVTWNGGTVVSPWQRASVEGKWFFLQN